MPIFKIPYSLNAEVYVRADNLDAACDEVEYNADAADIVESSVEVKILADDYNSEQVKGIPASARLL